MGRTLLQRIEKFLKAADMPPSVFGRMAAQDPRLVSDMRGGREVGNRLKTRIEHSMNMWAEKLQNGDVIRSGDRRTKSCRARLENRISAGANGLPQRTQAKNARQQAPR